MRLLRFKRTEVGALTVAVGTTIARRRLSLVSRLLKTPVLLVPVTIILALIVMASIPGLLAPYGMNEGSIRDRLRPPAWIEGGAAGHLLGTDKQGRDVLSRVIYGARLSLTVSFLAITVGGLLGTAVGLVSGYVGGVTDTVLMRIVDVFLSLPLILVAILLAVTLGPSVINIIVVVAFLLWSRYARVIRGETLSTKERDFVEASRVVGASPVRIMIVHVFPNVIPTLLVLATLQVGAVILLEASLSFFGIGVPPPQPSWGLMVAEGRGLIGTAWWLALFPGLAITLTVFAFNLLGDWLRDVLDPRLRGVI